MPGVPLWKPKARLSFAAAKFYAAEWLIQRTLPGAFLFYLACNMALTAVASALTVYWAPGAAGSGIPEIKARCRRPLQFSEHTLGAGH